MYSLVPGALFDCPEVMPKEARKPDPIGAVIRDRVTSRMEQLGVDEAKFVARLVSAGMTYDAAHMLKSRILKGRAGRFHSDTLAYLEAALEIENASALYSTEDRLEAKAAVLAGVATAPKAKDSELLRDFKMLLADPDMAPYIRLATKILVNMR